MTIRKVPVINEGRAALELKFDLMKKLPGYDRFRERIQIYSGKNDQDNSKIDRTRASISETKRSHTLDMTLQTIEPDLSEVLDIEPTESIILQPGKIANVVIKYKSMRRMRPFMAKVAFQTNSTIQPLFILRGSCIGAEFCLNRTYIPFGIVVQGCLSEAKVVLSNTGDIGARLVSLTIIFKRIKNRKLTFSTHFKIIEISLYNVIKIIKSTLYFIVLKYIINI